MVKTVVYIEGSSSKVNGDLRKGFRTLLSKKVASEKFQIIPCNDKHSAVRMFNKDKSNKKVVVTDLDKHENFREQEVESLGLKNQDEGCFFMVQEMEAWFLSQPEICKLVFGNQFPNFTGDAKNVENPSKKLKEMTAYKKHPYHKVKHATDLLENLNIDELENNFPDVKRLVETLSK